MATLFVRVVTKLEAVAQGNPAPFIAKIYKNGQVKPWKTRKQLLKFITEDLRDP